MTSGIEPLRARRFPARERMGENVTGMSADVDDLAIHGLTVDDVVQIEGDRPRVIERLDDCDPDWRDYLSE
jgi:hypothetical protein